MPLSADALPSWYIDHESAMRLMALNPDRYVVIDVQALPDDLGELLEVLIQRLEEAEKAGKTPVLWDTNPHAGEIVAAYHRRKVRRKSHTPPTKKQRVRRGGRT